MAPSWLSLLVAAQFNPYRESLIFTSHLSEFLTVDILHTLLTVQYRKRHRASDHRRSSLPSTDLARVALDAAPLRLTKTNAKKLLKRLDALLLARAHGQLLTDPAPPPLKLRARKRRVAHQLARRLVHVPFHADEDARQPAGAVGARVEAHDLEVFGEELHLCEAVGGDPGLVGGVAVRVDPHGLVRCGGGGRVLPCGRVAEEAVLRRGVGEDGVGDEGEGEGRAHGADADVDEVFFGGDGDDVYHVVPVEG